MELILSGLLVWLAAPIPLAIFLIVANRKKKRREELLLHLYMQGRVSAEELRLAGMAIPQVWAPPTSAQTAPVPPVSAAQIDPEQALADAAERAARIAEAELSGAMQTEAPAALQVTVDESAAVSDEIESAAAEPITESDEVAAVQSEPESLSAVDELAEAEPIAAEKPVPPAVPPIPVPPAVYPQRRQFSVSAITVMLSVGVLLIITAGLIFVRTAWGQLSDPGRLATLAAGSVLFFGTAALARRVWRLDRTGMAFFTLGAAFLPISVWAAGYLNLLGDGLSGAGNPWLLALAFASFTIIALIAVKIYQQLGWGIAVLCGLTLTYLNTIDAAVPYGEFRYAIFVILLAVYALIFAFSSRILRQRQLLPIAIGRAAEPFALAVTGVTAFVMLTALVAETGVQLSSVAVFLTAFAFFAPAITERLGRFSAIPTSILTVIGFGQLMTPLYDTVFAYEVYEGRLAHYPFAYFALLCVTGAALWLLLLLTNSLPEQVRKGYFYAAFSLTVISFPAQLGDLSKYPVLVQCAAAVLMVLWILAARKRSAKPLSWLIAAQCWLLAVSFGMRLGLAVGFNAQDLIVCGMLLLCFVIFVLTKKHRTVASDLLFTAAAGLCALNVVDGHPQSAWYSLIGTAVLAGLVLLYWHMALRHDTEKTEQFIYALLTPTTLVAAVIVLANGALHSVDSVLITMLWSVLSVGIGMATYLTTKRRFHTVRRLLFALTILPPLVAAVFAEVLDSGSWIIAQQLICAAAAVGVWFLFANHGFHKLENASFFVALLLVTEATVIAVRDHIYDGETPFTLWMIAALWVIACSLLAIVISKRILLFVGNSAIPAVMQAAAPLTALSLSCMLLGMSSLVWEPFYFVFTLGLCVLAWFVTKKEHILLPALCGAALIFTLEALRRHCLWASDGFVAVMLLCFAGLTLLFPYLGTVSREMEERPPAQRRARVLTALGGVVPFWLIEAAVYGTEESYYSDAQMRWMMFFVPVLLAGYILHLAKFTTEPKQRRAIVAASAALGMIAFWMQPLFDVSATYFEGKLHILPMIAFGMVIRRLYGEKIGGGFLFCVGIYAMQRLAFGAMATELPADLITVLVVALVMFIASFYIKQKKWFLLGGISLILTAVYMHMKLTDGLQWWVYLLTAGLVLIVVAASNEMLKQRGDSLKSRAGRLWEDWTW